MSIQNDNFSQQDCFRSTLLERQCDTRNKNKDFLELKLTISQLEKLQAEFKEELHSGTVEFMKTKVFFQPRSKKITIL